MAKRLCVLAAAAALAVLVGTWRDGEPPAVRELSHSVPQAVIEPSRCDPQTVSGPFASGLVREAVPLPGAKLAAAPASRAPRGWSVAEVRALCERVEVGMTRVQVDGLLGAPVSVHSTKQPPLVGDDHAWYLPPPPIGELESPYAPGTILVVFGPHERVLSKSLNPQLRDG